MKKIFEATYIYAILIFIGFYNYHSYYSCFDISIASFLTPGELLLSFLPLSTLLLGIAVIIMINIIGAIVQVAFDNKESKSVTEDKEVDGPFSLFTLGFSIKSFNAGVNCYHFRLKNTTTW